MADFAALVSAARRDGWASASGDIDSVRQNAASLGWVEVATRRGDAPVTVLRPVEADAAHPRSLSAADTPLFGRIADELGIKFGVTKATWVWPGRSVVEEVHSGMRAETVRWLAAQAHKTCASLLQQSMEQAWHEAFDSYHAEASRRAYAAGRRSPHPM